MYFDLKYGEIPIKVLFLEFDVLKNNDCNKKCSSTN